MNEKGSTSLMVSLFIVVGLGLLGLAGASTVSHDTKNVTSNYLLTRSFYIAESGIQYALAKSMKPVGVTYDTAQAPSNPGEGKILICHKPPGNPANSKLLVIGKSALSAHLAHGDEVGAPQIDYDHADPWTWSEVGIPIEGGTADVTVARTSAGSDTVVIVSVGKFDFAVTKLERRIRFVDFQTAPAVTTGKHERVSCYDEDDRPIDHKKICLNRDDDDDGDPRDSEWIPEMDLDRLKQTAIQQGNYCSRHLTVGTNSKYPERETGFYSDSKAIGMVIEGDMVDTSMTIAFAAEGRIGNAADHSVCTHEMSVGRSTAGPFYSSQTDNVCWESGEPESFTLTYNASNRKVYFYLGNVQASYTSNAISSDIQNIYIRVCSAARTELEIADVKIDGQLLQEETSVRADSGSINVLKVTNGKLSDGFTLGGNVRMVFPTSGSGRPKNSQLSFQIKVGKDNHAQADPIKTPNVTWIDGDLTLNTNAKIHGIVVVCGKANLNNNTLVNGVLYFTKPSSGHESSGRSCTAKHGSRVEGSVVGHTSISGPSGSTFKIKRRHEYASSFYQYSRKIAPTRFELLSWRQY
jgi:hypothetical protein